MRLGQRAWTWSTCRILVIQPVGVGLDRLPGSVTATERTHVVHDTVQPLTTPDRQPPRLVSHSAALAHQYRHLFGAGVGYRPAMRPRTPDSITMMAPMAMNTAGTIQWPHRWTTSMTCVREPSHEPARHQTATPTANMATVIKLAGRPIPQDQPCSVRLQQ
jgi:hypothetical protein